MDEHKITLAHASEVKPRCAALYRLEDVPIGVLPYCSLSIFEDEESLVSIGHVAFFE
jgi:hypothetical protein